MKQFKIEMFNAYGVSKDVTIEAKTRANAKKTWDRLFGKYWSMAKINEVK